MSAVHKQPIQQKFLNLIAMHTHNQTTQPKLQMDVKFEIFIRNGGTPPPGCVCLKQKITVKETPESRLLYSQAVTSWRKAGLRNSSSNFRNLLPVIYTFFNSKQASRRISAIRLFYRLHNNTFCFCSIKRYFFFI